MRACISRCTCTRTSTTVVLSKCPSNCPVHNQSTRVTTSRHLSTRLATCPVDTSPFSPSVACVRCVHDRLARRARVRCVALEKCPENLGTTDARSSLAQGAGAYYAPSAMTIYRAESAAAHAERELARVRALAKEDQTAFQKARTLWTRAREEARERAERYRTASAARASAKQALDAAKKVFAEADRESERTRAAFAEAERAEAESELAYAKAESRLGAHEQAIAAAKAEVERLSKIAEKAIKSLKMPFA